MCNHGKQSLGNWKLACYHCRLKLACLLLLFLIACSCEKSTTNPPPPPAGPDTTSHHFTWQIDTIGLYSSYLLDVAIVDENDIWAVGEIHTAETDTFDSLGNWVPPYNAVHWDGQQWELKWIPTNSVVGIGYYPIHTVFAFGSDNIWMFSDAGSYCHWNGTNWQSQYVPERQGGINKIWGSSSTDLYFVGTNGNITHYNGSSWQKLESGTTVDIQDIWGALNPQTGEYEILAVASFGPVNPTEIKILQIRGTTIASVSTEGLPPGLSSIWFIPGKKYYLVGDGVFHTDEIGKSWQHDSNHPMLYKSAVRGSQIDDVIIVGGFGLVSHFNGVGWHHYKDNELPSFFGTYGSVDYQSNFLVAVGWIGDQAIILRGWREK
ncbi:MAG: glucosyl transferase [Calditrichaceae bacterium]|nr:glucosyl transferase [Calditrichia bacterium]NUQ39853.1 glucosyl transferase [Calditrichaceae bacterium]